MNLECSFLIAGPVTSSAPPAETLEQAILVRYLSEELHTQSEPGDTPGHALCVPQYECTDCGRGFTYKQNMQRHIMSAYSEKPPLYKCKICDKSMTTAKSRDCHILHVHNNVPRPQRLRRPRKPQAQTSESDFRHKGFARHEQKSEAR
ncbi:jg3441 [Pararge aegeria aegeria]|uniref:Jg3441 protein n=1 Tax=Pararge aegeria aegeria TaxID=348720 RepID=A0A8S4QUJ2_9NEOP|nr:jg3441 [Pararge aegeria aegeria]